ncbi:hypothetical protein XELAEV_18008484mg [Xenopus laevis]|uniref:Uncharacterized protein n=1 Tax=Xenopus laevis TaxID=8355 RepID=A0A974E4H4_XENLA|nr:hypothetical protein XELAEV_18008484mg [Xenopus laevis]
MSQVHSYVRRKSFSRSDLYSAAPYWTQLIHAIHALSVPANSATYKISFMSAIQPQSFVLLALPQHGTT